jgi:uncharacterized protein (TIGR03437 family)
MTLTKFLLVVALGRASAQTVSNYSQVDVPGAAFTYVYGLNNKSQLLDWVEASTTSPTLSIVTTPDRATWTTVHVPGIYDGVVHATGINNTGQIVGNYPDSTGTHGFIRSSDGQTITAFDGPFASGPLGPEPTYPASINDKGEVVGRRGMTGFLRSADGSTYSKIQVPGAYSTNPTGINNSGQIVGSYTTGGMPHGFLRNTDGTYTTFDVPGSLSGTGPAAINNNGVIVGSFGTGSSFAHGFVRSADGTFATFNAPGGFRTYFTAINDSGQVAGYSGIDMVVMHGLTVSLGPSSSALTVRSAAGVITAVGFGGSETISSGSWIEIYGQNLAGSTRQWTAADFSGTTAPTSLDRVSVSINGEPAFVSYVSPEQVNAMVPSSIKPGTVEVTVTFGDGTSAPYSVSVSQLQPSVLQLASPNYQLFYAVATFPDGASYALPSEEFPGLPSSPAKAGETITFYGIGFGEVDPSTPAGQVTTQLNSLKASLQVTIGGVPATATYAGLMPGVVGLYQINVVVPPGVPTPPINGVAIKNLAPVTFTLNGTAVAQRLYAAFSQ